MCAIKIKISLNYFCCLLALLCIGHRSYAQIEHLRFEHIITGDESPIGETNVVYQDHMGFIWFGGSNGLGRYDGTSIEHYYNTPNNPNSLSHNFVWDVIEDSKQRIWVATPNGLNQFHRDKNSFTLHKNSEKSSPKSAINDVYKIYEDYKGKLWLGTRDGLDLFDPETGKFTRFQNNPDDPSSIDDNVVLSIYEDQDHKIWVGTQNGGLNLLETSNGKFKRFYPKREGSKEPISSGIRDIEGDNTGGLWLSTETGLFNFKPDTESFIHYKRDPNNPNSLTTNRLWNLFTDKQNNLWISSGVAGLSIFNPQEEKFVNYQHSPYDNASVASNNIRNVYQDNSGNFWIALFPSGVDFVNLSTSIFAVYNENPGKQNSIPNHTIDSIHPAPDGKIWIGTEGGLSLFDPVNKNFEHFKAKPKVPGSLSANAVLAIEVDNNGQQWFGTWSGGLNLFDPQTKTFKHYLPEKGKNSISSEYVWSLLADSKGNLWIGHESKGLDQMNLATGEIKRHRPKKNKPNTLSHRFVRTLMEDEEGNIWIGSLVGLNKYDPNTGEFTRFFHDDSDVNSLANDSVLSLYEDRQGNIWVGTEGGLSRFDKQNNSFTNYSTENGFSHNSISSVIGEPSGRLWLTTSRGVIRFDPETEAVENFSTENGLAGNFYNRNASYLTESGELYLGSAQGFTVFSPDKIRKNKNIPPVQITDFKIFNKSVQVGEYSPLKKDITLTDSITLHHKQSMITFEFAALNYVNSNKNRFQYMLEGLDTQWIDAGTTNTATYTNLNFGNYTFRVRGSNNDDVWNMEDRAINIKMLPPPWLTPFAFFIYALILASIVYYFFRHQRNKVLFEKQKVEQLKSLDKLKDEFLANTSHELRTPLNGIIGLTESLIDEHFEEFSPSARNHLKMIASSGRRLSNLINDILDFSKIRHQGLSLNMRPVDLYVVSRSVITMTAMLAEKKGLRLVNDLPQGLPMVIADEDRLQQILYNLIGNAIKFTNTGHVRLSALIAESNVKLYVEDTGIGIPAERQRQIFDSFSQAEGKANREFEGTGLGLTVAKKLIELQGGKIIVESKENQGSTFAFTLPAAEHQVSVDSRYSEAPVSRVVEIDQSSSVEQLVTKSPNNGDGQFHILVVDDDPVNRQVLVSQLALHQYRITEVPDGFKALELVKSDDSIDLILLDVMMPRMTGYETATRIRVSHPVHELPIIFVTAKHLASDLVSGFVSGGNDFLVKPISKNELLSRVKTHLQLLDVTRNLERLVDERTKTLQQTHHELEQLDTIVNQINQEDSLEGLSKVLLEQTLSLFDKTDFAAFFLEDENTESMQLISTAGDTSSLLKFDECALESKLIKPIIQSGRGDVFIVNPRKIPLLLDTESTPDSIMALLIQINDKVAGVILLVNNAGSGAFVDNDIKTLKKLQSHAVSAVSKANILEALKVQNQKLELASLTDQLTGLSNRRHLIKNIEADIAICDRKFNSGELSPSNANLLFMLIDIDHFKQINDTYGHAAGDLVLKQFSQLLSSVFRESDYLVRWGGEEFMVVVRFCDRDEANLLAERFRKTVEAFQFNIGNGSPIKRTCSIGYSYYPFYEDSPSTYTWEQVVDIADISLYAAKKTSRNAWVGIYGKPSDPNKLNYSQLSVDPQQTLDNTSLRMENSFYANQKIEWN